MTMSKKLKRFKRFKHKIVIKQDSETIELTTEIKRHNNNNNDNNNDNDSNALNNERLKSKMVYESMRNYLNSISHKAIESVYDVAETNSEQDDETSIQELITFEGKPVVQLEQIGNESNRDECFEIPIESQQQQQQQQEDKSYEIHQIAVDEKVDEIDNFAQFIQNSTYANKPLSMVDYYSAFSPIDGDSIAKTVEKLPDIQDFDETVAIVDSVVVDHISEDDKSTSSDEVTYERWTEETRTLSTKVFDQNGQLVDEIVEHATPELVGNILREKIIEKREHIKHISQDVLKLVKVKSPGQSRRQSVEDLLADENSLDASVIIVEPTVPSFGKRNSFGGATTVNNTYCIQHQQIITPTGAVDSMDNRNEKDEQPTRRESAHAEDREKRRANDEEEDEDDYESIGKHKPEHHKHECDDYTNVSESGYKSSDYLTLKSFKSLVSSSVITTNERISSQNFDMLMREEDDDVQCGNDEHPLNQLCVEEDQEDEENEEEEEGEKVVEHERSSMSTTTTTDNDVNKKKSEMSDTTTPNSAASLESMQRFERPSKQEMQQHKFEIKEEHESEIDQHFLEITREESQSHHEQQQQKQQQQQQIKVVYEESDEQLLSKLRENMSKMKQQEAMLDDVTDISEDEQNIFSSSLTSKHQQFNVLRQHEETKKNTVLSSSSSSTTSTTTTTTTTNNNNTAVSSSGEEQRSTPSTARQLPLRRESFEMAQKDKNKRLSASPALLIAKANDELLGNSGSKRLLSAIKPTVINYDSPEDHKQHSMATLGHEGSQTTGRRLNESLSSQSEQSDSNDSSILRHNYELLRKKSLEQQSSAHHLANSIRLNKSEDDEEEYEDDDRPKFTSNLVKCLSKPTLNLEPDTCPMSPISNGSSSKASTPLHSQRPAKIKVVKKNRLSKLTAPGVVAADANNNNNNNRLRSVSPGLLRRDIVETIETTTSMSFIMNKNVNLVVEEKRVPPTSSESPVTVNKLTKSQTNLASSPRHCHPLYEHMKSTPIPITVQSRSKSEPKLNDSANLSFSSNNSYVQTPIYIQGNYANVSSSTSNYSNQSSYQGDYQPRVQPQPAQRVETQRVKNYNLHQPLYNHELRNVNANGSSHHDHHHRHHNNNNNNNNNNRSRITFHKYDSNEIIAVVNVPGAKSDVQTIESINRNVPYQQHQQHLQEHFNQHYLQHCRDQNLSKSESDLMMSRQRASRPRTEHKNRTTDRWSAWPEYAVEQDTDCSMVSSPGQDDQAHTWVRTIRSSSSGPQLKPSEIAFEIEIEREEENKTVQISPRKVAPKITIGTAAIRSVGHKPNHQNTTTPTAAAASTAAHFLHHAHTHSQSVMMAEHEAAFATRMSSGYFSGDEFKYYSPDYYCNYLMNQSSQAAQQYQQSPTISSSSNQSNNGGNQFNISKFLTNRKSARSASNGHQVYDAIDEFDRLYKSIGFEEDDLLVNNVAGGANSSHMYGRFDEFDAGNQSATSLMTEDLADHHRFRPINSATRRQVRPDAVKDDMARRRCLVNIPIERDSSLNKSINSLTRHSSSFVSDYETMRKRSNSMSSLNPNESFINPLILPSPTCADYLRNKTRENALINVVMNPTRTTHNDVELSQILYDDMAFRQLRKDSEASKLAQIKSTVKTSNMMTTNTTRRHSTRLHQAHQPTYSSHMPTYYTQQTKSYFDLSATNGHVNINTASCTASSTSNNNNNNNNKTVKMLKHKDRLKENRLSSNHVYTNRYF